MWSSPSSLSFIDSLRVSFCPDTLRQSLDSTCIHQRWSLSSDSCGTSAAFLRSTAHECQHRAALSGSSVRGTVRNKRPTVPRDEIRVHRDVQRSCRVTEIRVGKTTRMLERLLRARMTQSQLNNIFPAAMQK